MNWFMSLRATVDKAGDPPHRRRRLKRKVGTSMNLKPLGDRVIVKTDEAETQTKSGLILADTAKEKPQRGSVIAVGEGKLNDKGERVPVDVKVGDTVIYSKYGGTEVKLDGEEYLILRADDIYAVVAS
jgi:chaperonin GroES